MLSGCPMAVPNWKLPFLVESSGAIIVGEESCIGTRNIRDLVEESGETVDAMLDAIADRYMRIDCACFTPNTERLEHVVEMARDLKADGVIHYGLSFCQPYAIEAFKVEKALKEREFPCSASKPTTAWRTWSSLKPGWRPLWRCYIRQEQEVAWPRYSSRYASGCSVAPADARTQKSVYCGDLAFFIQVLDTSTKVGGSTPRGLKVMQRAYALLTEAKSQFEREFAQ